MVQLGPVLIKEYEDYYRREGFKRMSLMTTKEELENEYDGGEFALYRDE